ncbi:unnamed protein product [Rotaria sordida]|uniref:Cytochrome b561 domain-containing protein n=1 Tax=Rotaria sordida TaxID=392033 RepID=A0A818VVM4_9BILA|nr:unnamed protein product [Rotaria sordida]CAF3716663.1 unnamed protein product [Rotaria sordida]
MFAILGRNSQSNYPILLGLGEFFGALSVLFVGLFFDKHVYSSTYNWKTDPFTFHPLMMTTGLLFCYGNAILLYRTFRQTPKLTVKILHALFLILSLIFGAVGFTAIVRAKILDNESHFISFHSWLGLLTLILFVLQWICGFISFLFPKLSLDTRTKYMPTHRFWGKIIFLSAVITILAGLSELGTFSSFFVKDDAERKRRLIMNFFGVFTLLFSLIVIYLLTNPDYQRPPDEDTDQRIQ